MSFIKFHDSQNYTPFKSQFTLNVAAVFALQLSWMQQRLNTLRQNLRLHSAIARMMGLALLSLTIVATAHAQEAKPDNKAAAPDSVIRRSSESASVQDKHNHKNDQNTDSLTKALICADCVSDGEHRQSRYLSYRYANDFVFKTDRDFTQGMQLTYFDPYLSYSPVFWLALELPGANESAYGLRLHWDGYTPDDLDNPNVDENDRPYSAYFHVSHLLRTVDTVDKVQLQTEIKLGLIGPETLGAETQRGVHRLIGGTDPQGWSNQIETDLVIDYRLTYQRQLWQPFDFVELSVFADASLGTLDTYLAGGPIVRLGYFQSFTPKYQRRREWLKQIYLQCDVEGRAIGYNARFQGGLFNDCSRHTLSHSDIELLTAKVDAKLVIELGNLELRFGAVWQSREFDNGHEHMYGYYELFVAF